MDFLKPGPSTEALRIESEPPGAEAKTASGQSCRTPCELNVQTGNDAAVTVALAGYKTQTVSLRPQEEGGKLGPNPVYAELQKEAPAAAKKKKTAARKPSKPGTTTTAAVVTPTTTASVPTPAPSAPAAEPAPAPGGTSYPWPTGR